jgi:uncharacterized protein YdeI (YjbR/CyaY-like superfamily)
MGRAAGSSADDPKMFSTPAHLRAWLAKHHASRTELWVGYYKKATGRPSITWPQLVDELLCFGWIDGVRRSLDASVHVQRITPRRRGSVWSAVNTKRAAELIEAGLMEPAGLAAFEARDPEKTNRYSYERERAALGVEHEAIFKRNRKAWAFFAAQPPGYRKLAAWYVMSAKREETQLRRLETLIRDSAKGQRIGQLKRPEPN